MGCRSRGADTCQFAFGSEGAIHELYGRLLENDDEGAAQRKGSGKVVSVFSPRGGSGKTTLAVNMAVLLARMFPDRVALLDLGVTFSHDGMFLGIEPGDGIRASAGLIGEADLPLPEFLGLLAGGEGQRDQR